MEKCKIFRTLKAKLRRFLRMDSSLPTNASPASVATLKQHPLLRSSLKFGLKVLCRHPKLKLRIRRAIARFPYFEKLLICAWREARAGELYYSQFGEDTVLHDIFQGKNNGVCVEVGANNGVDGSNTLFFEKMGWKCILVEPNPTLCRQIRTSRNALIYECAASNCRGMATLHVAEGAIGADGLSTISNYKEDHDRIKCRGFTSHPMQVQTMTLDEILINARINSNIDFITIDVEGHEYEVLQGFSLERWLPQIMLVEDNLNLENDKIRNYLKKFGYVRFRRTGVNDWYAHRTNKQLVNMKTRTLLAWTILKKRLRT